MVAARNDSNSSCQLLVLVTYAATYTLRTTHPTLTYLLRPPAVRARVGAMAAPWDPMTNPGGSSATAPAQGYGVPGGGGGPVRAATPPLGLPRWGESHRQSLLVDPGRPPP